MKENSRINETKTVTKAATKVANKIAGIVRILTIPALTSGLALTLFWILDSSLFERTADYMAAMIGLTLIPLLSYPASFLIPKFREKKREGQRKLAMYFSAAGYLLCFWYALANPTTVDYRIIMSSYILSILFLLLLNKTGRFKASGHACSTMGPALFVVIFCGKGWIILSALLIGGVIWSSLRLGRHKIGELMTGGAISVLSACLLFAIW